MIVFVLFILCLPSPKKVELKTPQDGIYQIQVVFKQDYTWLAVMQRNQKIEFKGPTAWGEPVGEIVLAEVPANQVDPKFAPYSYFAEVKDGQIKLLTATELRQRP